MQPLYARAINVPPNQRDHRMKRVRSLMAFCLTLTCLVFCPGLAQAAGYVLTDLGPGSAVAINNSGVIALNEGNKAFRVTDGERQELRIVVFVFPWAEPEVVYAVSVQAKGINDVGDVVGEANSGIPFADLGETNFVSGDRVHAATANAIGNSRTIAGGRALGGSTLLPSLTSLPSQLETFFYLEGDLGGVLETYDAGGELNDIRDDSVAVGTISSARLAPRIVGGYHVRYHRGRAARVENGQITFLDPRAPDDHTGIDHPPLSEAFALNASGEVVGRMALVADGPVHAFRHAGAGLEDLGTLGGTTSGALDINASGMIVGYSTLATGESRAFLWQSGTMTDLNTLVPAGTGLVLAKANAINDVGQIVGEARVGAVTNAFLLSPEGLGIAPRLTLQPTATNAALATTVTLEVAAIGTLPLSVQWEKGNKPIPGANALTLQLTNLTAFDDGDYRAVVTNAFGKVISQSAKVVVLDPRLKSHALVGLTLEGSVGASYRIEFTPSLGPVNWQPLETVTLTNALHWWVDFGSATPAQRTYRAIRLP